VLLEDLRAGLELLDGDVVARGDHEVLEHPPLGLELALVHDAKAALAELGNTLQLIGADHVVVLLDAGAELVEGLVGALHEWHEVGEVCAVRALAPRAPALRVFAEDRRSARSHRHATPASCVCFLPSGVVVVGCRGGEEGRRGRVAAEGAAGRSRAQHREAVSASESHD
jgi:hypothetical protein